MNNDPSGRKVAEKLWDLCADIAMVECLCRDPFLFSLYVCVGEFTQWQQRDGGTHSQLISRLRANSTGMDCRLLTHSALGWKRMVVVVLLRGKKLNLGSTNESLILRLRTLKKIENGARFLPVGWVMKFKFIFNGWILDRMVGAFFFERNTNLGSFSTWISCHFQVFYINTPKTGQRSPKRIMTSRRGNSETIHGHR